jgi:glycosidase
MELFHNSRQTKFRKPFGAVPTDEKVEICIEISGFECLHDCYLGYSYGLKEFSEGKIRMSCSENAPGLYSCNFKVPAESCLVFYWFEVITDNSLVYYTKNPSINDSTGVKTNTKPDILSKTDNHTIPFQITVYNREFTTPDWFKGAVVYQIFPDRFSRGSKFSFEQMKTARNIPERIYHENWNTDVDYLGKPENGYMACDFFGGSINGIRERLDYLKALGIDAIYLNPVFESKSNHRYDTGNYENIDPILGTNEEFVEFCAQAKEMSIRVILDGVFSHTGADSAYFNKYGRYASEGAYQDAEGKGKSPYFSWYNFKILHGVISYDSWWGFKDLPNVNENDLLYKEYILGSDGIVKNWIRKGASGWRLDVSDEIPDSFLRELRKSVKCENKDAVIMGEVWEDASNKVSYGEFRDFLIGNTHDCVMGYPFRNTVLAWLSGKCGVADMVNRLETIRENYPAESFYCNLNLISSHDIVRAITELSGDYQPDTRQEQSKRYLTSEQRARGERLLRLAMLMQFTTPGAPSVYYGDEIAMEGYSDPFNRRTFDWEKLEQRNCEITDWLAALISFRKDRRVFITGFIEYIYYSDDLLVFKRFMAAQESQENQAVKSSEDVTGKANIGHSIIVNQTSNDNAIEGKTGESNDNKNHIYRSPTTFQSQTVKTVDAFGEYFDFEEPYYVAINRKEYSQHIKLPDYEGELAAMTGVVIQGNNRVFEV